MRLTVSLSCYQRPQRTRRMIECIMNQIGNGYEILITGDGCEHLQEMIDSGELSEKVAKIESKGNKVIVENFEKNYGGFGYEVINRNIQKSTGKYILFLSNDDIILDNHFHNYVSFMESNPDLDLAYFDTWVEPNKEKRVSSLGFGQIGHAELVLKTELAKSVSPHTTDYGHDWLFIREIASKNVRHAKAENFEPTYFVMSIPGNREKDID